jgi:hypothetical protein
VATTTTLRPSATSSGVGWTATPSGTLNGVTGDDSDTTYALWSGTGSALILPTPADSPPAGERRHQVRLRMRGEDGNAWGAVRLASGGLVAGAAAAFSSSPSTVSGAWGAGAPADGSTVLSAYVTGQSSGVKIEELYLDVDSRLAPTFTPEVLDASGTSVTTVSDTAQPGLLAADPDLDDLSARQYRYWVTSGTTIVWDSGIVSGPSVTVRTAPLDNGTYTAHFHIWSTLGQNIAYASDEETLEFTVSVGTIPAPDNPTVTPVDGTPLYQLDVCALGEAVAEDFDDDRMYIEVQRVDCDSSSTVAILGPLAADECASDIDYSHPRTGTGGSCDHDPGSCCSYYRARVVGLVSGQLQISNWSDASEAAPESCLTWDDDLHLIRSENADGPLWAAVGGIITWNRDRPLTDSIGVMGTSFISTAAPGGRNFSATFAVESQADLDNLLTLLDRPLVLVSPADSREQWAAPVSSSVRIIQIGRIRQVTASLIGTGPQPSPQLADVGA